MARAFQTWKFPDMIEEVEETETITTNVVSKVDIAVQIKIYVPRMKVFTSGYYYEESKAEPILKSLKSAKAAIRNLDHILQIAILKAWTKWNQHPPNTAHILRTKSKKFLNFSVQHKPLTKLEITYPNLSILEKSFIQGSPSFSISTQDSSFVRFFQQENLEGSFKLIDYLQSIHNKKNILSRQALFKWQAKASEKNLKKKTLHKFISKLQLSQKISFNKLKHN